MATKITIAAARDIWSVACREFKNSDLHYIKQDRPGVSITEHMTTILKDIQWAVFDDPEAKPLGAFLKDPVPSERIAKQFPQVMAEALKELSSTLKKEVKSPKVEKGETEQDQDTVISGQMAKALMKVMLSNGAVLQVPFDWAKRGNLHRKIFETFIREILDGDLSNQLDDASELQGEFISLTLEEGKAVGAVISEKEPQTIN